MSNFRAKQNLMQAIVSKIDLSLKDLFILNESRNRKLCFVLYSYLNGRLNPKLEKIIL